MFLNRFRHIIAQTLVCLMIALNTYPAMQNIMADALGAQGNMVSICTMTGVQYISADLSNQNDAPENIARSEHCLFCQIQTTSILPPLDQFNLGPTEAYGQRLKIAQYRDTYQKRIAKRPHTRGPPLLSSI